MIPMTKVLERKLNRPFKTVMQEAHWTGKKENKFWAFATAENIAKVNAIFNCNLMLPVMDCSIRIDNLLRDHSAVFKTKPRPHQVEALAKCGGREFFAYFMEPGLGKTKTVIDDVMILNSQDKVESVLVVCPKSVIQVWLEQLQIHGNWHDWRILYWDGEMVPVTPLRYGKMQWFIINYDALVAGLKTKKKWGRRVITGQRTDARGYVNAIDFLTKCTKCMVVMDESTALTNPESLRTQQALSLKKYCAFRRILTGTPFANSPMDAYGQLDFLSAECIGHMTWKAFKEEYGIWGGYEGKKLVGVRHRNVIKQMLKTHGYRCRTVDVLDLPEPVFQIRRVEMSKQSRKMYDKFLEDEVMKFEGNAITAKQAATVLLKAQQITGGFIYNDHKNAITLNTDKLDDMMSVIKEITESKILVWCHYTAEVEMIWNRLKYEGIPTWPFDGSLNVTERMRTLTEFKQHPGRAVLVLQDDTGHEGLTINEATYALIYSHHTRPKIREQMLRRNWRDGQRETVIYIDFLTDGVDSYIFDMVKSKREMNEGLLDEVTVEDVMRMARVKKWKGEKKRK